MMHSVLLDCVYGSGDVPSFTIPDTYLCSQQRVEMLTPATDGLNPDITDETAL